MSQTEPEADNITEFLTSLQHHCREHQLDFGLILRRAVMNFEAETKPS